MAAIQASDIVFRLSGGAANTSPAASLGGAMSTAGGGVITSGQLNNVFDDITGDENAASDIEYRGIYVQNNNANNDWENVVMWLSAEVSGGASVAIAVALEAAGEAMATIADESTAPDPAVTWSTATSKGTGVALGTIPKGGGYRGIWIKRTATNSAALSNDGATISVSGDTGSL